ncbi:ParB N-terminal domain-containing protein [Streptomyces sp. NPDC060053]|uniref:ParB N-terminal domain-containing protein n=1 Tax=Streptomyces sp. NPDC060053 TaxID=3347047 RepID=UPI0036B48C65
MMNGEEESYSVDAGDAVFLVPVNSLSVADTPRLEGESQEHIEMLLAATVPLPPIVVHRPTMRVIDGVHRLRAAMLRGQGDIAVRFFDGDEASAFVLAVRANTAHGLPLSRADRTAAAERIVKTHSEWSDRAIAAATGVSPKTVAALRRRSTEGNPQSNTRLGRDGRVRPMDVSAGRREAGRLIADNPDIPLRQVARAAGVSVGTAHDVRERLRLGQDPVPEPRRPRRVPDGAGAPADPPLPFVRDMTRSPHLMRDLLRKDPSLRFTDSGRALLRLFDAQILVSEKWEQLIGGVPSHCTDMIVDLAIDCARTWQQFAERLMVHNEESA